MDARVVCRWLSGAVVLALLALPLRDEARAGQVRINVGTPTLQFSPRAVNLNLGDHAVWVWTGGSHTVTSGDSSLGSGGSVFDSGQGSGLKFSWKSDRTGHVNYFCIPHSPDMAGRVIVSDPGVSPRVAVADFRVTEIQFNVPGGQDLIEITNHGDAAGNLGRYRLAISPTAVEIPLNDFAVPAGGRVVVHANASGTNDATNIYLPTLPDLPDAAGSVALYVPNSTPGGFPANSALTQVSMIIDFVQWGAGGQPNETTANLANLWTAGTSIDGVAPGHSIEYCPNATLDHGLSRWAEIEPNIGSPSDCTTPLLRDTWGHLKVIYRQ